MFSSIRVFTRFQWPVSTAGYALRTVQIPKWYRSPAGYLLDWDEYGVGREVIGRRHGDKMIVERKAGRLKHETPLDDQALFMNFATLDCSEVAVLKFVARYGFLTLRSDRQPNEPSDEDEDVLSDTDESYDFFGEPLELWFESILLMKLGIQLWTEGRRDSARRTRVDGLVSSFDSFLDMPHRRDLRTRIAAVRSAKDAMRIAHSIAVGEFEGGFGIPGINWSFVEAMPSQRYVLQVSPDTLGTGLFLQFAMAMAADSRYRQCEHCGGFFDGTAARRSRKYCGDSCKTRAYNARKEGS